MQFVIVRVKNYEDIQFYWAAAEGVIAIFIVVHKPGCTLSRLKAGHIDG
jgi:hypothetical protein